MCECHSTVCASVTVRYVRVSQYGMCECHSTVCASVTVQYVCHSTVCVCITVRYVCHSTICGSLVSTFILKIVFTMSFVLCYSSFDLNFYHPFYLFYYILL